MTDLGNILGTGEGDPHFFWLFTSRDIAVIVEGESTDFTILVYPSKWINNLTSLTVMSLLSLGALLPFCGIATLWIVKIRKDLKEFIDLRIDFIGKAAA